MDEARSLFAELQKLFPPAFVISSTPKDDMRDQIEDAFRNEPWMVTPRPYRVYPPRTEITFEAAEDGTPI